MQRGAGAVFANSSRHSGTQGRALNSRGDVNVPFLDGCVYVAGERVVVCRSAWKARVRRTEESGGIRVATQACGLEADKSAEVAPTDGSRRALEGKRGGDGRFRARSPGSQTRKFFTLQRRPANLPSRRAPSGRISTSQALSANALSKSRKCASSTTPAQRRRAVVGRLCAVLATGGINAPLPAPDDGRMEAVCSGRSFRLH
jgi:hypothetical protein